MAGWLEAEEALLQYDPVLLLQLRDPGGNGPAAVGDPSSADGVTVITQQREVQVLVAYIDPYVVHVR